MRYTFESAFAPHIIGLIEQKRADGFIYFEGEKLLKRFDTFCIDNFPDESVLTREIIAEWSVVRPKEGRGFRDNRVGAVRQLGLYMLSLGIDAYVPHNYSKAQKPVLYIPTREEMTAFFKEMAVWKSPQPRLQRFIDESRMMCLLYYCCGLRLSEAILLKKEHVDWDKGMLTVYASKGHKDRLVYLPQDGVSILAEYLRRIEKIVPDSPWMFPGTLPSQPISDSSVENRFNACWARLPFAANANKHPTPHCLRHAFVVERMNEWMLQGFDTKRMLAYLSKYLGHTSPEETHYYYHLVKKAFAIIKQKDTVSSRVIPEVVLYEED
jgi:integrase